MRDARSGRGWATGIAIALLLGSVGVGLGWSAHAAGFCALDDVPGNEDLIENRWVGPSAGDWVDDANWSQNVAPNDGDLLDGYVCIPAGVTVTLDGDTASARIQALDLATGARLDLVAGTKLYVSGDQDSRPTRIRKGALLTVTTSTLGGAGRIVLDGRLFWTSTINGAATITTRDCSLGEVEPGNDTCPGPVAAGEEGLLDIGDTGAAYVDGRGVNLEDQYHIVVRGLLKLTGESYLAADRGTSIELRPRVSGPGRGRFVIGNDGGLYEGRTLNGNTMLAVLVNQGSIVKAGTDGTAIIAATYSRIDPGSVTVKDGTLLFPGSAAQVVAVDPLDSYGTGACADYGAYACTPRTDPGVDLQSGTFTVPKVDADGAKVTLFELGSAPAGSIGDVFRVHAAGLDASRRKPALLTLQYDASLLGGKGWADVQVRRKPDGAGTAYTKVPSCKDSGRPPAGSKACVDRRGLAGSSADLAGGDVLMVIRTLATSRWVAR